MRPGKSPPSEIEATVVELPRDLSGSCALNLDGVVTWSSDGPHLLFASGTDPIGTPFHHHWSAADRSGVTRAVALALQQGRSRVEGSGQGRRLQASIELRRDTHRRPVELHVIVLGDQPQSTGLIVPDAAVDNASGRKQHDEALSKSEKQFRTLFEHLPVGAALADRNGHVVLENDVFARLLKRDSGATSNIFARACTALASDGTLLPEHGHPLRQALQGQVARDVELLCRNVEGEDSWLRMSAIPIFSEDSEVTGALVVISDIHREKLDETRRTLLINELNHRVKNTLATVQSIASQTFRASALTKDGLEAFEERLLALSNAHNMLTQEHWEGADLKRLVARVLEPHDPGNNRLSTSGPSVRLKPPAALAFAMAVHELATNAVKYGAFSSQTGRVELHWHISETAEGRRLRVIWTELDGPPVIVPTRRGFGTRLIERALAFELGSVTSLMYKPTGVVCDIDADMSEISG